MKLALVRVPSMALCPALRSSTAIPMGGGSMTRGTRRFAGCFAYIASFAGRFADVLSVSRRGGTHDLRSFFGCIRMHFTRGAVVWATATDRSHNTPLGCVVPCHGGVAPHTRPNSPSRRGHTSTTQLSVSYGTIPAAVSAAGLIVAKASSGQGAGCGMEKSLHHDARRRHSERHRGAAPRSATS